MISVREAQDIIDAHTAPRGDEHVPLAGSFGRVLREPVAAPEDMPPFDRSAMDGYAVRADDSANEFEIISEIRAGASSDVVLKAGQAIRIFTGAPLPGPGLKVIMQENVVAEGSRIHVQKRDHATHVRQRGEDAHAGEVLLPAGLVLDAAGLALLASLGAARPLVARLPSILHLTTGDEIVAPELKPAAGQIRNSNAPLIAGLCRQIGLPAPRHLHANDDLPALLRTLDAAGAKSCDAVLISGGSGGGAYDFTHDLFRHLEATVHFRAVNVRPGKPLIFGTAGSRVIFGLPGNVLSHFVCFHLFVGRALRRMAGRAPVEITHAFLTHAITDTHNARESWYPARIELRKGRVECRALAWSSSGDITRLPGVGALVRVPPATARLDAGTLVDIVTTS